MGVITTDNLKGAGRDTILTDELFKKIKECILAGKTLRDTAKTCEINEGTFYVWHSDNYLKLADKIEGWKRDRKINLAEGVIDEMLEIPVKTLHWQGRGENAEQIVDTDVGLVRVKQDTAKFVLETLKKESYSRRSELTGKDGSTLIPENTKDIEDLTNKLNALYQGTSEPSNGEPASIMGIETSNQE